MSRRSSSDALLDLIDRHLREGAAIEIDGMGSFQRDADNQIVFEPKGSGLVFLGYAQEDRATVRKLYRKLHRAGLDPWMDCENLLPGQNWPRAIERAIELSDFFVGCFSSRSIVKRGHFQSELAYALDAAKQFPQEEIFFIPARLDVCEIPRQIAETTHYVDLFPDWNRGVRTLVLALRKNRRGTRREKPTP